MSKFARTTLIYEARMLKITKMKWMLHCIILYHIFLVSCSGPIFNVLPIYCIPALRVPINSQYIVFRQQLKFVLLTFYLHCFCIKIVSVARYLTIGKLQYTYSFFIGHLFGLSICVPLVAHREREENLQHFIF